MSFTDVLLGDLLPYFEANYPALPNRAERAISGLSMGAGTALNTGLTRWTSS